MGGLSNVCMDHIVSAGCTPVFMFKDIPVDGGTQLDD